MKYIHKSVTIASTISIMIEWEMSVKHNGHIQSHIHYVIWVQFLIVIYVYAKRLTTRNKSQDLISMG